MEYTSIVGIDCGKDSFALALRSPGSAHPLFCKSFSNSTQGIKAALRFVISHEADLRKTCFCIEKVGVYAEKLCYQLHLKGLSVYLADPGQVHHSIVDTGYKTDRIDSIRIAEYAVRYFDRLTCFEPKKPVIERIQALLKVRQLAMGQRTQYKNQRATFSKKWNHTSEALQVISEMIEALTKKITQLEKSMDQLISSEPRLAEGSHLLETLPGVGKVTAIAMLTYTEGFKNIPKYRRAASHLGIAPKPFESGSSIYRAPRSRRQGPSMMRHLLHMSAKSTLRHPSESKQYYDRKLKEGKPSKVAMNNLCNRQLKLMLAILRNWTPYQQNYQSVHPKRLHLP